MGAKNSAMEMSFVGNDIMQIQRMTSSIYSNLLNLNVFIGDNYRIG